LTAWSLLQTVLLDFVEELAATDAQELSGARAVPALMFQRLRDHSAFRFRKNVA